MESSWGWGHGRTGGVLEVSDGFACCYTEGNNCYYQRSVSWTPPPGKLYPGEKISLSATLKNEDSRTNYFEGLQFSMFFQDTAGYSQDIISLHGIDAQAGEGATIVATGESTVPSGNYGQKGYVDPPPGVMYIKAIAYLGPTMGIVYVYTWQEGGATTEGTDIVNETKWKIEGSPVNWIFHKNGTVEAPGLWSGTWELTIDGYIVNISQQGLSDSFTVIFSSDGQTFTAYKNGDIYKKGSRK